MRRSFQKVPFLSLRERIKQFFEGLFYLGIFLPFAIGKG
jgi:hypothetical protein